MTQTILFIALLALALYTTSKDKKQTIKPFDLINTEPLRGLLALLIIGHHLGQRTQLPFFSSFMSGIGSQIVAIFFMLSGYGLFISYKRKGQLYLHGFLKKRYSKILPLFIPLTIICMITALYGGDSLTSQAKAFLLYGKTPLPFSWFIYAIIYAYAAFYISAIFGKTVNRTGILFLVTNLAYILFTGYYCQWGSYWFMTFISLNLGYYIGLYEDYITLQLKNRPILVLTASILLVICSFCAMVKLPAITSTPYAAWGCLWHLSIAFATYLLIRTLGMGRWKSLIWIGAFSMEIYLIHGIPLTGLQRIWQGNNDILFVCTTYVSSILLAYFVHRIFSKTSTK